MIHFWANWYSYTSEIENNQDSEKCHEESDIKGCLKWEERSTREDGQKITCLLSYLTGWHASDVLKSVPHNYRWTVSGNRMQFYNQWGRKECPMFDRQSKPNIHSKHERTMKNRSGGTCRGQIYPTVPFHLLTYLDFVIKIWESIRNNNVL